jgi:hypothetical protein
MTVLVSVAAGQPGYDHMSSVNQLEVSKDNLILSASSMLALVTNRCLALLHCLAIA